MKQSQNAQQSSFKIRTYYFRELALLYFPASTPDSASQAFRRMLRAYRGLPEQLHEKGFVPGYKIMPPAVVEIVVRCLGEP